MLLFHISLEWFLGFIDGVSRHTCNLDSPAWVIFAPTWQLVASGGAYLCPMTNKVAKYNVVIELLGGSISHGINCQEVRIDSQLVVSHLNGVY